jgi:ribulose-5-phosphate 4-epimerase/fuculose-1-phosphate aldolase
MASNIFQTSPDVGAVVMTLMAMGQELMFVSEPSLFVLESRIVPSWRLFLCHWETLFPDRVAKEIAAGNIVIGLKNHAFVVVGRTVEEAWLRAYMFEQSSHVQIGMNAEPVELSNEECACHASSY